MAMNNN